MTAQELIDTINANFGMDEKVTFKYFDTHKYEPCPVLTTSAWFETDKIEHSEGHWEVRNNGKWEKWMGIGENNIPGHYTKDDIRWVEDSKWVEETKCIVVE